MLKRSFLLLLILGFMTASVEAQEAGHSHGLRLSRYLKTHNGQRYLKVLIVSIDLSFKSGTCPARKAGIQFGDLIESIDGRRSLTYDEANRMLKKPTVKIRLIRPKTNKTWTVELRQAALRPLPSKAKSGDGWKPVSIKAHKLKLEVPKSWSVTVQSLKRGSPGVLVRSVNQGLQLKVETAPIPAMTLESMISKLIALERTRTKSTCTHVESRQVSLKKTGGPWQLVKLTYCLNKKHQYKKVYDWTAFAFLNGEAYSISLKTASAVTGLLPKRAVFEGLFKRFDCQDQAVKPAPQGEWREVFVPGHDLKLQLPKSWTVAPPTAAERASGLVFSAQAGKKYQSKSLQVMCEKTTKSLDQRLSEMEQKMRAANSSNKNAEARILMKRRLTKSRGQWLEMHFRLTVKRDVSYRRFVWALLDGKLYKFAFELPLKMRHLNVNEDSDFSKIIRELDCSKSHKDKAPGRLGSREQVLANCRQAFLKDRALTPSERSELWAKPDSAQSFLLTGMKHQDPKIRYWCLVSLHDQCKSTVENRERLTPLLRAAIESDLLNDSASRIKSRAYDALCDILPRGSKLSEDLKARLTEHYLRALRDSEGSRQPKERKTMISNLNVVLKCGREEFLALLKHIAYSAKDRPLRNAARIACGGVEQRLQRPSVTRKTAPSASGWSWRQIPGHNLKFRLPRAWILTRPKASAKSTNLVFRALPSSSLRAKSVQVVVRRQAVTMQQWLSELKLHIQKANHKASWQVKLSSNLSLRKTRGEWRSICIESRAGKHVIYDYGVLGVLDGIAYEIKLKPERSKRSEDPQSDRDFQEIIRSFDYSKSSKSAKQDSQVLRAAELEDCLLGLRDSRGLHSSERKKLWSDNDSARQFLVKNMMQSQDENVRYWSMFELHKKCQYFYGSRPLTLQKHWVALRARLEEQLIKDPVPRVRNYAWRALFEELKAHSVLTESMKAKFIEHFWGVLKSSQDVSVRRQAIGVLNSGLEYTTEEFLAILDELSQAQDKELRCTATLADYYVRQRLSGGAASQVGPMVSPKAEPEPKPIAKPSEVVCQKCQRSLKADSKFCDGCGHKVGPPKCHKCQRKLKADSKFCDNCGAKQK